MSKNDIYFTDQQLKPVKTASSLMVCSICRMDTTNIIRHDILFHNGFNRVNKYHEDSCREGCCCAIHLYKDMIEKMIG